MITNCLKRLLVGTCIHCRQPQRMIDNKIEHAPRKLSPIDVRDYSSQRTNLWGMTVITKHMWIRLDHED